MATRRWRARSSTTTWPPPQSPALDPDDPTIREELATVLAWASDEELITVSDARLLVDVVAAAQAWRAGYPDSIPLLGGCGV